MVAANEKKFVAAFLFQEFPESGISFGRKVELCYNDEDPK